MHVLKLLPLLSLALPGTLWAQDCVNCLKDNQALAQPRVALPKLPTELIHVRKVEHRRNPKAKYCTRPVEMIDTIVLHHSASTTTTSAETINTIHLSRGNAEDPWAMIGYSYVINSPYQGQSGPTLVSEGRPLTIVGAHAGSTAFTAMDNLQTKLWDQGKIKCGKDGEDFKVDEKQLLSGKKIKVNATSIGVVVIGNFSPFSRDNPTGYVSGKAHYPSAMTINAIARLSCQLQKKHPRMKKIGVHSSFKDAGNSTLCPGNIKNYLDGIKAKIKEYGCNFY